MKKQTFLIIASVYLLLPSLVLIFLPDMIFQTYGFPSIESITHEVLIGTAKDFIFYTGVNSFSLGVLAFLSRNGVKLKSVFLVGAINLLVCGLMVVYKNANVNTPISAWIDMTIRLTLGLGFLYYYFTEKE